MTNTSGAPTDAQTVRLTRRGLRLAQFTIAYNVAEGVIAVTAGLVAGLISVVGFGFDSAIESLAAILVALRLSARLRHGLAEQHKERLKFRKSGLACSLPETSTDCLPGVNWKSGLRIEDVLPACAGPDSPVDLPDSLRRLKGTSFLRQLTRTPPTPG